MGIFSTNRDKYSVERRSILELASTDALLERQQYLIEQVEKYQRVTNFDSQGFGKPKKSWQESSRSYFIFASLLLAFSIVIGYAFIALSRLSGFELGQFIVGAAWLAWYQFRDNAQQEHLVELGVIADMINEREAQGIS